MDSSETEAVCFLILHYNSLSETISCISSIQKLDDQDNIRIVIVDNGSPDESGLEIAKRYRNNDQIRVLLLNKNAGFSVGNNAGFLFAKETWDFSFLIVANNDVIFCQTDFVNRIKAIHTEEQFDVLGPDICVPDTQEHQNPLQSDPPGIWDVRKTIILNELAIKAFPVTYPFLAAAMDRASLKTPNNDYKKIYRNVCLQGACIIYSKSFFDNREHLFYPETFFYYEEFIQAYQCRKNKKQVLYRPDIQVMHLQRRATEKSRSSKKERTLFRVKHILKSAKVYRAMILESRQDGFAQ